MDRETAEAWKQESQTRRALNRAKSSEMLTKAGIKFVAKNQGAHLIITEPDMRVDFWPGTGRWITSKGCHSYGVKGLIGWIETSRRGAK